MRSIVALSLRRTHQFVLIVLNCFFKMLAPAFVLIIDPGRLPPDGADQERSEGNEERVRLCEIERRVTRSGCP